MLEQCSCKGHTISITGTRTERKKEWDEGGLGRAWTGYVLIAHGDMTQVPRNQGKKTGIPVKSIRDLAMAR